MPSKIKPSVESISLAEGAIREVSRLVKFTIAELPVSVYVSRFTDDENDRYFVPVYQRNLAWNDEQKSEFIESLIVGLPVPFMSFYQTKKGRMEIVDGSQRMRAMRSFLAEGLKLRELSLVPELNGFTFEDLPQERRNKLEDVTIRTIVLDTETDPSTRAEMFARLNRTGTVANEAEIRRGSLPGKVMELIIRLAKSPKFVEMTPMSEKTVNQREREELITRFFAYTNTYDVSGVRFPNYRDRPKKYLFTYLKSANEEAAKNAKVVKELKLEFETMLEHVRKVFPLGFKKNESARTIPRVRFEAIAVGTALAIRENSDLNVDPKKITELMSESNFDKIVVSDGSNVRSKLVGRIDLIRSILVS